MTLTVTLDPADEAASELHRTVLASLPARFRVTAGPGPDVALISGDQPGWQQRAADADPARAIMLTGTRALTAATLRDLANKSGTPTVGCLAYGASRAWATAVPRLAPQLSDSSVLDSVSTAPCLRTALADQVAVIRALAGDLQNLTTVHLSDGCYVLAGAAGGVTVTLTGTLSSARRLRLDLVGTARRWHASLDADALARPARISVSDAEGEHLLPPLYESSYRAAWAALHDALREDAPLPYAAAQLADDLAVVEAALDT
jgi:hypothetical protein